MKSNRELFQEMRDQEAQTNESPIIEEEKPKKISALERRVAAYEMGILRNKVRKFGNQHVFKSQDIKRTNMSDIETRPLHNHAKPLTDFQKLYHVPKFSEKSEEEYKKDFFKDENWRKKLQESFENLKKS